MGAAFGVGFSGVGGWSSSCHLRGMFPDPSEILGDPNLVNILDYEDARLVTDLLVRPQRTPPNGQQKIASSGTALGIQHQNGQKLPPDVRRHHQIGGHNRALAGISDEEPKSTDQANAMPVMYRASGHHRVHSGPLTALPAGHHIAGGQQMQHSQSNQLATPAGESVQHLTGQGDMAVDGSGGAVHQLQQRQLVSSVGQQQQQLLQGQTYAKSVMQFGGAVRQQPRGAEIHDRMGLELQQPMRAAVASSSQRNQNIQKRPAEVAGTVVQQQQLRGNLQLAPQNQTAPSVETARLTQQQSEVQALFSSQDMQQRLHLQQQQPQLQQRQQQSGVLNPSTTQAVRSLDGAQTLILAAPAVLHGQELPQTTFVSNPSNGIKGQAMNNGMNLSGANEAILSRAAAAAHQLHSAVQAHAGGSWSSISAMDQIGVPTMSRTCPGSPAEGKHHAALSAALEAFSTNLNEDGTLPLSTFEKIVQELSGIESLQSMLMFRPNKKKGKGGRQPAKDPRLDPNIDPRKAKRIVANRQSAARSKMKQKQHLEDLQLQHDTLTIQNLLCRREMEKLEKDNIGLLDDSNILELEIRALTEHVKQVDTLANFLLDERNRLRSQMCSLPPYAIQGAMANVH